MILPESCRVVRGSGTKRAELALEQDTEKTSVGRCSRNFRRYQEEDMFVSDKVRLFNRRIRVVPWKSNLSPLCNKLQMGERFFYLSKTLLARINLKTLLP